MLVRHPLPKTPRSLFLPINTITSLDAMGIGKNIDISIHNQYIYIYIHMLCLEYASILFVCMSPCSLLRLIFQLASPEALAIMPSLTSIFKIIAVALVGTEKLRKNLQTKN